MTTHLENQPNSEKKTEKLVNILNSDDVSFSKLQMLHQRFNRAKPQQINKDQGNLQPGQESMKGNPLISPREPKEQGLIVLKATPRDNEREDPQEDEEDYEEDDLEENDNEARNNRNKPRKDQGEGEDEYDEEGEAPEEEEEGEDGDGGNDMDDYEIEQDDQDNQYDQEGEEYEQEDPNYYNDNEHHNDYNYDTNSVVIKDNSKLGSNSHFVDLNKAINRNEPLPTSNIKKKGKYNTHTSSESQSKSNPRNYNADRLDRLNNYQNSMSECKSMNLNTGGLVTADIESNPLISSNFKGKNLVSNTLYDDKTKKSNNSRVRIIEPTEDDTSGDEAANNQNDRNSVSSHSSAASNKLIAKKSGLHIASSTVERVVDVEPDYPFKNKYAYGVAVSANMAKLNKASGNMNNYNSVYVPVTYDSNNYAIDTFKSEKQSRARETRERDNERNERITRTYVPPKHGGTGGKVEEIYKKHIAPMKDVKRSYSIDETPNEFIVKYPNIAPEHQDVEYQANRAKDSNKPNKNLVLTGGNPYYDTFPDGERKDTRFINTGATFNTNSTIPMNTVNTFNTEESDPFIRTQGSNGSNGKWPLGTKNKNKLNYLNFIKQEDNFIEDVDGYKDRLTDLLQFGHRLVRNSPSKINWELIEGQKAKEKANTKKDSHSHKLPEEDEEAIPSATTTLTLTTTANTKRERKDPKENIRDILQKKKLSRSIESNYNETFLRVLCSHYYFNLDPYLESNKTLLKKLRTRYYRNRPFSYYIKTRVFVKRTKRYPHLNAQRQRLVKYFDYDQYRTPSDIKRKGPINIGNYHNGQYGPYGTYEDAIGFNIKKQDKEYRYDSAVKLQQFFRGILLRNKMNNYDSIVVLMKYAIKLTEKLLLINQTRFFYPIKEDYFNFINNVNRIKKNVCATKIQEAFRASPEYKKFLDYMNKFNIKIKDKVFKVTRQLPLFMVKKHLIHPNKVVIELQANVRKLLAKCKLLRLKKKKEEDLEFRKQQELERNKNKPHREPKPHKEPKETPRKTPKETPNISVKDPKEAKTPDLQSICQDQVEFIGKEEKFDPNQYVKVLLTCQTITKSIEKVTVVLSSTEIQIKKEASKLFAKLMGDIFESNRKDNLREAYNKLKSNGVTSFNYKTGTEEPNLQYESFKSVFGYFKAHQPLSLLQVTSALKDVYSKNPETKKYNRKHKNKITNVFFYVLKQPIVKKKREVFKRVMYFLEHKDEIEDREKAAKQIYDTLDKKLAENKRSTLQDCFKKILNHAQHTSEFKYLADSEEPNTIYRNNLCAFQFGKSHHPLSVMQVTSANKTVIKKKAPTKLGKEKKTKNILLNAFSDIIKKFLFKKKKEIFNYTIDKIYDKNEQEELHERTDPLMKVLNKAEKKLIWLRFRIRAKSLPEKIHPVKKPKFDHSYSLYSKYYSLSFKNFPKLILLHHLIKLKVMAKKIKVLSIHENKSDIIAKNPTNIHKKIKVRSFLKMCKVKKVQLAYKKNFLATHSLNMRKPKARPLLETHSIQKNNKMRQGSLNKLLVKNLRLFKLRKPKSMVFEIKKIKKSSYCQKIIINDLILENIARIVRLFRKFIVFNKVIYKFKMRFMNVNQISSQKFMRKLTIPNYVDKARKLQKDFKVYNLFRKIRNGELILKRSIVPLKDCKKEINSNNQPKKSISKLQRVMRVLLKRRREYKEKLELEEKRKEEDIKAAEGRMLSLKQIAFAMLFVLFTLFLKFFA